MLYDKLLAVLGERFDQIECPRERLLMSA